MRNNFNQNILNRLGDLEEQIVMLERDMSKTKLTRKYQQITSPFDGIVHEVAVRGVNEVVNGGDTLISIVPADMALVAEVQVPNLDLSYIQPGQKAALRLDAFPYQQFGKLEGTAFLGMVQRKVVWLQQNADRLVEMLST